MAKKKRKTREDKEKMRGYNPHFGETDGKIRGLITSNAREIFRNTVKREFIRKMRYKAPSSSKHNYLVMCNRCSKEMGHTEKFVPTNADGTLSQRKVGDEYKLREILVFQVDHVDGITPFQQFEDLGDFFNDLMFGELQILCYECHGIKTAKARKEK